MLILQRYVHGRVQSVPCLEQQHQLGRPHIDNSQVYETSHATTTTMMTTTTRATLVKNWSNMQCPHAVSPRVTVLPLDPDNRINIQTSSAHPTTPVDNSRTVVSRSEAMMIFAVVLAVWNKAQLLFTKSIIFIGTIKNGSERRICKRQTTGCNLTTYGWMDGMTRLGGF